MQLVVLVEILVAVPGKLKELYAAISEESEYIADFVKKYDQVLYKEVIVSEWSQERIHSI